MIRVRTVLILIVLAAAIYALVPPERKQRIRGKFREIVTALTLALILYWIYMISLFAWNHWKGR